MIKTFLKLTELLCLFLIVVLISLRCKTKVLAGQQTDILQGLGNLETNIQRLENKVASTSSELEIVLKTVGAKKDSTLNEEWLTKVKLLFPFKNFNLKLTPKSTISKEYVDIVTAELSLTGSDGILALDGVMNLLRGLMVNVDLITTNSNNDNIVIELSYVTLSKVGDRLLDRHPKSLTPRSSEKVEDPTQGNLNTHPKSSLSSEKNKNKVNGNVPQISSKNLIM